MKTLFLRRLLTFVPALFLSLTVLAQADGSGTIKATVVDERQQPMPGTVVRIIGSNIGGTTDLDGVVTIRAISAGTYDVEARMLNYKVYIKKAVIVKAGQTAYLDFAMQLKDVSCDTCVVFTVYAEGPIDKNYSTITNISAEQIRNMAVQPGNIVGMVTNTCSSCSQTPSGGLVMRGSRPGQSQLFVDGEKMYGSANVPGLAIGQVTVLSGGIPAEYGDLSGGAIIVTTKNYNTGFLYKQAMYEAVAAEQEAARIAEAEKKGVISTNNEIIEHTDSTKTEAPAPVPAPENAPAPNAPAPTPAPAAQPQPADQPRIN